MLQPVLRDRQKIIKKTTRQENRSSMSDQHGISFRPLSYPGHIIALLLDLNARQVRTKCHLAGALSADLASKLSWSPLARQARCQ